MRTIKVPKHLLVIAEREAQKSNVARSQMSALILSSNYRHVVAMSHNIRFLGGIKWTLHAEERLLVKHRSKFNTIVVYRSNGRKTSKPCPRCMRLLKEAGVNRVIYFDGREWIAANVKKMN